VRLLASNGVRPAVQALAPSAESAITHSLAAQFSTTTALKQRIEAGEQFDVAILTAEGIDSLIQAGKIAARGRADLGSVPIGVGVRSGTKPDLRTVESVKQMLLNVKSITYAADGASRLFIEKMFEALGVAGDVKSKITLRQGSDASMAAVAAGEAEVVITLVSEIMQAPGIQLVGLLPERVQNYVHFAAAVSANAQNREAANALIQFLTSPKATPTFRAKGIQTGPR
jgi:molybdate transport system substrate-binding protein